MMQNCFAKYAKNDELLLKYHDEEWGKPSHDEQHLISMFMLELFQAGLSWAILLHKRENFLEAFDDFDVEKIARYDEAKINELLNNTGIVRNRLKIQAAVINARIIIDIQKEYGSFEQYIWHFTEGHSLIVSHSLTTNGLSDDVSKDLKKRGMKFAGSTTVFSYLQAVGIIYSHPKDCWRYEADGAEQFKKYQYKQ